MTQLDEHALRTLVREAVARHLRLEPGASPAPSAQDVVVTHASHVRYALPKTGGPCLIEPAVSCNRCGYCESHGH